MLKNITCQSIKRIIIVFITLSIFNATIIKPIDIIYIKDTYSILSDEFKQCSPVHGAVWSETQLLKKYYNEPDVADKPKDSTITLLRELFNLIGDSLSITKIKPAKYFSPQLIGSIIGTIEQNRLIKKNDIKKEIEALINTNIVARINADPGILNAPDQGKAKGTIKSNVTRLAKAITNSLSECGFFEDPKIKASYPPYTTHAILLSFLYKLSKSKNDLREYFNQLKSTITLKDIFTDDGKKIFEKQTDWNSSCFNKSEVDSIINICAKYKPSTPPKLFSEFLNEIKQALSSKKITADPYEATVFAEIIKQFYHQSLPKLILDDGPDITFGSILIKFADCTETAIRNLCNFTVYNQTEKKFIPTSNENLHPSKELLEFYGKNNDATKHTYEPPRKAWSDLIQNIPGVIYVNIISKTNPNEHFESASDQIFIQGKPCYVLLTKDELRQIDKSKISKNTQSPSFHTLSVDNEEFTIAAPTEYTAYALWPSLKNIIIILNRIFGLELYKDQLLPFKDEHFCSTYFPKLCEKFGWEFDVQKDIYIVQDEDAFQNANAINPNAIKFNLDMAYTDWGGVHVGDKHWGPMFQRYGVPMDKMFGHLIHIKLSKQPETSWDIFINKHHAEIKNVKCPSEISGAYREKLFKYFSECEKSNNSYELLALYAPKTDNGLFWVDDTNSKKNDKGMLSKLKQLKNALSDLKNKLLALKSKLETLKSALK